MNGIYEFKITHCCVENLINSLAITCDFRLAVGDFNSHRCSPRINQRFLNDSVSTFIEWRKQSKRSPVNSSKTYGLVYDDPKNTEPEKFRFDICGSVRSEVPGNVQNVINKSIPAGRCAVIRHSGSHELMDDKVHYLYGEWLPDSGEELRDFPCFFHYLNFFPEVAEHELITDIYLPLAMK